MHPIDKSDNLLFQRNHLHRGLPRYPFLMKRMVPALLFLLLLIHIFSAFLSPDNLPRFVDFDIYHDAGKLALEHKTAYVEFDNWPGKVKFKYSPLVSLIFGFTVSQLPLGLSRWAFYWASLLGWLSFAALFAWRAQSSTYQGALLRDSRKFNILEFNTTSEPHSGTLLSLIFVAGVSFLTYFVIPLRDELKLGQINLLPLLCIFAFFCLYENLPARARLWGGLLLSIAIQFKLYALIVLPYLFFRKEIKLLFSILFLSIFSTTVLLIPFHGTEFIWQENLRWLATLTSSSTELIDWPDNVSLLGLLTKHGVAPLIAKGIWGIIGALSVLGIYFTRNARPLLSFCYLMILIALLNPIVWPYWILFIAPMLLFIGAKFDFRPMTLFLKPKWAIGSIVLLFLTNSTNRVYEKGGILIAIAIVLAAWWQLFRSETRTGQN